MRQPNLPGVKPELGADGSDSCFTPAEIIEGATACLGGKIHTDPCWHPSSMVPDGPIRYDGRERGDGLAEPWAGSLWMNPPYSKPEPWCRRFRAHALLGHPCLALVRLDPTTDAWGHLMLSGAKLGLASHRVCFLGDYAKGGTPSMCVAFVAHNISLTRLEVHLPMAQWWERRAK